MLHYRYHVLRTSGDVVEMIEWGLQPRGHSRSESIVPLAGSSGELIKRWDNVPHSHAIESFPHHLQDGAEDHVVSHPVTTALEVFPYSLEGVGALEHDRE